MKIEIKEGTVLNDGAEIAIIEGTQCLSETKLSGPVKGAIRKASENPTLAFAIIGNDGDTPDTEDAAPPDGPVFDDKVPRSGIARLMHAVEFEKIPPPPPTNPQMGDKDPAFVAWYKVHANDKEFEQKYGNRKLPSIAEFEATERQKFAMLANETKDTGE